MPGRIPGRWKISQLAAIQYIENGTYTFYTMVGWNRADVIVATSQYGNKYLKTANDGEQPNNL